jgi:glutamate--cysteine ligase
MTTAEDKRASIIAYFESGSKDQDRKLGVEVEHFIITEADGVPFTYAPQGDIPGLQDVLEHLLKTYPAIFQNAEGELIGCANEEASVSLEPSAQIEVSIAPFETIAEIGRAYAHFREAIDPYLQAHGAKLVNAGYHPTRKAEELTLIPKERYRLMDAYFAQLGTLGLRMMRASASTQVSIDYVDEADAVRKMRVASALAPILGAIADNVAVYERKVGAYPLVRLAVWRNVDDARCGVVPGVFAAGFGFGAYADWMLRTSPIFVNSSQADGSSVPRAEFDRSAGEIYADEVMTKDEIEHLISMFWPDVRLKRFVEIRPADSLPQEYLEGYAALIKGLFYSEESLRRIEHELGVIKHADGEDAWPLDERDVEAAIKAIREHGYEAVLYEHKPKSLRAWEELLFSLAREALSEDERGYLDGLERFALNKHWELIGS